MPICDHIAFRVHNLEKTIQFYEAMLPAKVIARRHGTDFMRSEIAWLEPEGQEGFAIVAIQPTRVRWLLWLFHKLVPRQTRSFEHIGLACPSREAVDERARVAKELGVRVLFPPTFVDEQAGYLFEVVDPDNNPIEWTHGQQFR